MRGSSSRFGSASPLASAVRVGAGLVFVLSGAIKFLFENQGVGRFTKIGLPSPQLLASFVGGVEIVAGTLLVLGLFTRVAALLLVVNMIVAIVTTKLPILFGAGPEPVAAPPKTGFLAFAYQARLDLLLLCVCAYLLVACAGPWSLDFARARKSKA